MTTLILFLPLIGSVIGGLFGFTLNRTFSKIITTSSILITFLFTIYTMSYLIIKPNSIIISFGNWMCISDLSIDWCFIFNTLTCTMLLVINSISFCIHLYSCGYMSSDPQLVRFLSLLSLFTFYMNILVCADNFLVLFLGWEGVGLCSFLLISFWYNRILAVRAAIKAFIVNKIGDSFLIFGIALIFKVYRSLDFAIIFSITPLLANKFFYILDIKLNIIDTICFFLFIGIITKSAQLGMHTWLPDAMEGPTPVSALIHAATMVTAGIFLLIKCSFIFEYCPKLLCVSIILGSLTAFFGATVGVVQYDIKKIIAYSTCSQLGYMMFACGCSNYQGALYHLVTHAYFKSLLFLSAGAIIYSLSNEQDIRKMGSFSKILPLTYSMFLISSLALIGFPFLSGFYSKDIILEIAYVKYNLSSYFAYWLGSISTMFTSFYSFRLLYFVFFDEYKGSPFMYNNIKEIPLIMSLPLIPLALGSIFLGYLVSDIFIGLGSTFYDSSIYVLKNNQYIIEAKFLPYYIKLIPTMFTFLGFLLFIITNIFFNFNINLYNKYVRFIMNFLINAWYFDTLYNNIFTKFLLSVNKNFFYFIEKGIVEWFGPFGLTKVFSYISNYIINHKMSTSLNLWFYYFLFYFILLNIFFIIY